MPPNNSPTKGAAAPSSPTTTPSPDKTTTTPPSLDATPLKQRWIWIVTGPTASGKTSTAKALADYLDFPFIEGDDVPSPPLSPLPFQDPTNIPPSTTPPPTSPR